MVMVFDIKVFFIFLIFVITLRTCEEVDDTMDGKDNKEEKTREVAYICMHHFSWNYFNFDMICCG